MNVSFVIFIVVVSKSHLMKYLQRELFTHIFLTALEPKYYSTEVFTTIIAQFENIEKLILKFEF